jgi:cysteinyl-tRNA synthetase
MTLQVYDTLRGRKEEFKPLQEGKVGIYFCGLTVQGIPHVGHMLAFVAGDMIRRYLNYKGFQVTYVQNFTDVDDKIIAKAWEEGVKCEDIAERNIKEYFKYAEKLNIIPADVYPRATEHIDDILNAVQKLVDKGFAYNSDGNVYFRVRKSNDYGKLSRRKIDELKSGARIEVGEQKEDPLDFTLWKKAKEGEPSWESPWGRGRPGWHIECSVMSMKYLGETLDMHGGGQDLVFPHHENEIAQSEALTGKEFVRFWLHNGLLNLKGEKMSKSTGHFFSMEEVCAEFRGEVIRFYLLSTHFRNRAEFSRERLEEAEAGFERIEKMCIYLSEKLEEAERNNVSSEKELSELSGLVDEVKKNFLDAMDDDFNSAGAIGHVFRLVKEVNRTRRDNEEELIEDTVTIKKILNVIEEFDSILGLFGSGLPQGGEKIPEDVMKLVDQREEARSEKNWELADRLRDKIAGMGYIVEDGPEGSQLTRKKN